MPTKVKFRWNKIEQYAFNEIKGIVAYDILLTYQDFNEEFNLCTYAKKLKIVAVINQKGKTVTFYGRKLTDTQKYIH